MLLNAGVQLYDYFYPLSSFLALQKTLIVAVSDGLIHSSAEKNLTMGTKMAICVALVQEKLANLKYMNLLLAYKMCISAQSKTT